ncbi:hypothetical protein CCMSSC00406_0005854 [Pleurotus cornucopiae]|uniref:Uncharacterized protein n=1 Tax=Pleurotus cornucopiae TaxID=5321 RepID=A0ACB7J9L8_PLECO|nr:hypothetical protein CCMSSC00406_0005854 [Pleurotus cornucopiae]
MSGGVDSSVAAKLLAEQDYNLSAIFMRNWDTRDESGTDKGCEWEKDWQDVQQVCRTLDIPCRMIDLSREYWNRVFEPSLRLWESGVTPNPDVWCNKEIKFGALLDRLPYSESIPERAWFATGHYARKLTGPRAKLLRAVDRHKDQTYYLSSLSEASLNRALFPIGGLTKPEVREIARKHNLVTAERPESMGLCFVGEKGKFRDFLDQYIPPNPGPIVDLLTGKTLGEHNGLWTYTIGENARISGMPMKMFVSRKDTANNRVYVVPGTDHIDLWATSIRATGWSWIWADSPPIGISQPAGTRLRAKFRHKMEDIPCTVRRWADGDMIITFDDPQKAVSPGQVVALWDADWCLGCGTIVEGKNDPPQSLDYIQDYQKANIAYTREPKPVISTRT